MIAYPRFNSTQFNKKTRFNSSIICVQFSQALLVHCNQIFCNFAGRPAKIPYMIHDNTGTQTWEYSESDFCECYTIDIEMQNELATASSTMSSWEFSMCSSLAQKRWIVIGKWSWFLDSFWLIMDSDSLGIHVDWVKTQLRFIITAFHKTQPNSNSTLPAEPVDSTRLRFTANKLGSIHLDSYFVNLNPIPHHCSAGNLLIRRTTEAFITVLFSDFKSLNPHLEVMQ